MHVSYLFCACENTFYAIRMRWVFFFSPPSSFAFNDGESWIHWTKVKSLSKWYSTCGCCFASGYFERRESENLTFESFFFTNTDVWRVWCLASHQHIPIDDSLCNAGHFSVRSWQKRVALRSSIRILFVHESVGTSQTFHELKCNRWQWCLRLSNTKFYVRIDRHIRVLARNHKSNERK